MAARRTMTAAVLVLAAAAGGCREVPSGDGRERVTIDGETFLLEVAGDPDSRATGLMHRTEIPEEGGMLFVFPDAQMRSFWMKDCLVDIDLIFLDPRGRVTALHRMAALPPRGEDESELDYEARVRRDSYWSNFPAQFAIELKAGSIDRLGVSVEDRIELDLPRLKARAR